METNFFSILLLELASLKGISVSKKFCLFSGIGGVFDRVLITYPNDKPLLSSRINNVSQLLVSLRDIFITFIVINL